MSAPYNLPERDEAVPSHWLQLEIAAKEGRHTAHGVELQMLSVHRIGESGEEERINLEIAQFNWSNSYTPFGPINLAPGLSRKVDIAALVATDERRREVGKDSYTLWLQAQPRPSENRDHLIEGVYLVKVALVADDTDAAKYQFEIHFDGLWWKEPAIWDHLAIRNLRKVN